MRRRARPFTRPRPGRPAAHTTHRSAARAHRDGGLRLLLLAPPARTAHPARGPRRPARAAGGLRARPRHPGRGARQLAHRLPGSRLVTLHDDYSHGMFASRGNPCVDGTVAAYLVDGTVPAAHVHCAGPGLPTPDPFPHPRRP
ncbi:alpha/beta hydrolase [Streptomyces nogalater]